MDHTVCPWNSPGQNTEVGSLSLLQGIFPTQGSNSGLPHCRRILYQLSHKGSPRILEWVAYSFSGDLPNPGIEPGSPAWQVDSLPTELSGKPKVTQSCLTLCNPMDCSLPGSSVRGIFQARVLEWVAVSFSRRSSQPRDQPRSPSLQADALPSEPPGKTYM